MQDDPASQPLDLYARAAPDHPQLAAALRSVLTDELGSLCSTAINQAATETDLDLLLGEITVASHIRPHPTDQLNPTPSAATSNAEDCAPLDAAP